MAHYNLKARYILSLFLYGFFLLFHPLRSPAQMNRPILKAIYQKTVTTNTTISLNSSSAVNQSDSILFEFSKEFFSQIEKKGLQFSIIDSIEVYKQSAIMFSKPVAADNDAPFQVNIDLSAETVYYDGKSFYSIGADQKRKYWSAEGYKVFHESGLQEEILGYKTKLLITADSTEKVWICEDLSPLLNPGVKILNVKGGILKYASQKGKDTIISIARKLEK